MHSSSFWQNYLIFLLLDATNSLVNFYLAVVPSSGIDMRPFIPPQQLCPMTTIFSTYKTFTLEPQKKKKAILVLKKKGILFILLYTTNTNLSTLSLYFPH